MAPVHGSLTKLFWAGFDLSSFGRQADASGTADVAETTTFQALSKSYIPGLKDASFSAGGVYDAAAGASAQVLEGLLAAPNSPICHLPEGDTAGKLGLGLQTIATKLAVASPVADIVSWSADGQSSVGLEQILNLHALVPETVNANGTGQDNGAASALGLSAYLHVMALAGTAGPTLSVKVQHSVDNVTYTDLITFTTVSAANKAERKAVPVQSINRWLRVTWTITGTTPSFTFYVGASRIPGAPS